ncbi:S33 family peptidase [Cordyceps fumosorosea ARSEF 2679]|uniref:S33 family peptidase n=1 Tax=Cordyceps fumosorosea (strain ARSEF 2679) TaxID=1081104 RepID=A0A167RNX0_CORFA|nr:S33 family peptidase [Cordyceps fumosorosea ARSEF 2679]OAA58780.1 S33 family peptidase [Cordyceps fumosorosea ARSEF 2679]
MASSTAVSAAPEREPLLPNSTNSNTGEEPIAQRRPWWKRKRTILKGCGVIFLLDLCISGLLSLYLVLSRRYRGDVVLRYPNETIVWKPCGDTEGKPLECGTIVVPMDHFNTSRCGNETFTVPLVRLRGSERATHNVLINPGGPGASGVDWFQGWAVRLQKAIGDDFHLVAFDPRGIGESQPAAVCFGDAKTRRTHQIPFDGNVNHDIERYMEVGNYAQACADHMGEHVAHVNTPQTAADMNTILDALGQDGLYYLGYSYGTTLGATFATMFPERTERVVIDGVLDSFAYYDELSLDFFCEDDENALAGFFDECVKETNDCKLSGFGLTGQDIKDNVTTLLEQLQDDGPLPVYINSTMFGTISYDSIINGIFMAMYSSKLWYSLADNLAQLLSGNTTGAFLAYADSDPTADGSDTMTEHSLFVMNNDRPSGHPAWPNNRYDVLKIVTPDAERCSPWSQGVVQGAMLSAQWKVPKAHGFMPRRGVETRHPILVMSSTYDPVCPISAAKRASASFVGAKLIEVRGIGHTALSLPSACATRLLRAYMVNGTMPTEDHTRCDRDDVPYFVSPGKEAGGRAKDATGALVVDEEVELMATLRDLSGAIPVPQFARTRF